MKRYALMIALSAVALLGLTLLANGQAAETTPTPMPTPIHELCIFFQPDGSVLQGEGAQMCEAPGLPVVP